MSSGTTPLADPGLPSGSQPPRGWRIAALSVGLLAGIPLLLALVLIAGSALLLGTEAGSRWVLQRLASHKALALSIEGPTGSFWGGLSARRIEWKATYGAIELDDVRVRVHWSSALRGKVVVSELEVGVAQYRPAATGEPARPPESLALPLSWRIDSLGIARLRIDPKESGGPQQIESLRLSAEYSGGVYRVTDARLQSGGLALSAVRIELADTQPFALTAQARAEFEPARAVWFAEAARARLAQGPVVIQLNLTGELSAMKVAARLNYGSAQFDVETSLTVYQSSMLAPFRIRFEDLEPAKFVADLPLLKLSGSALVSPGLETVQFDLSNREAGRLDTSRVPAERVVGVLRILPDRMDVDSLEITLVGPARVTAALSVSRVSRTTLLGRDLPRIESRARFEAVNPQQLSAGWPQAQLSGEAHWLGDRVNLSATEVLKGEALALSGSVRLRGERVDVERFEARTEEATIEVHAGHVGLTSPHDFDFRGAMMNIDPERVLRRLGLEAPAHMPVGLSADWQAIGQLVGPAARVRASLDLRPGRYAGEPLRGSVKVDLVRKARAPSFRPSGNAEIVWGDNRLAVTGALGQAQDSVEIDLRLARPSLIDRRLQGSLSAQARLSGALDRPALSVQWASPSLRWGEGLIVSGLEGTGEVSDARSLLERVRGRAPTAQDDARGTRLRVGLAAREISVSGERLQALALTASGSVASHDLEAALRWAGHTLAVSAVGELREAAWQASVNTIQSRGLINASQRGSATIVIGAQSVQMRGLALEADGGVLELDDAAWSPKQLRLSGKASAVSLRPLIDWLEREASNTPPSGRPVAGAADGVSNASTGPAATAPPSGARAGEMRSALARSGDTRLQDPRAEAAERVRRLRLDATWSLSGADWRRLDGRLLAALRPETESGVAAQDVVLGDSRIDLQLRAGAIDGTAELSIPSLRFSQRYTAPDWTLDGALFFSGRVRGRLDSPELLGGLRAERLSLFNRSLGWRLRDGVIDARFEGRDITLHTLRFLSGDGAVTMAGKLRIVDRSASPQASPRNELPLEGRLQLDARRLQVPLGPGQRLLLTGLTELVASGGELAWRGRLRADEGLVELRSAGVPELPADVRIRGQVQVQPVPREMANERAWTPRVQADLVLDLGDRLRVRGGGVDARLGGELTLEGALPAAPRVRGTVQVREGSFSAYSRQLEITRGLIRFAGDIDNPLLDIVAMRRNQPVEAGVAMSGSALSPRIRLVSEPDVPDAQKLSWLVLGSSLDDVSNAGQARALGEAAFTLLGRDDDSLVANLSQRLGIDAVSMGASRAGARDEVGAARLGPPPLAGANAAAAASAAAGAVRQEVVTVSKRLSSRLTLSYERGLSGLWNLVRLQYDISNRLSVRAQSGSENALDLLYFWWFD